MLFTLIIIKFIILHATTVVAQTIPVVTFEANAELGFREVLPGVWTGYQSLTEHQVEHSTAYEYPHLDLVLPLTGAWRVHHPAHTERPRTGKGIVVCIIDSGIDIHHPDFGSGTRSRILRLWDQTHGQAPLAYGERRPTGFSYGIEYRREDLEARSTPIRSHDLSGHGTHIAGIIAGSGAASDGRFRGMAPDADLVVIRAGTDRFPLTHVLDGMAYCDDVAREQGVPAVLNLSLGTPLGPHDGSDLKNRMASAFASQPGRAAVLSAGNTGHLARHTMHTLHDDQEVRFTVHVPEHTSGGIGHEQLSLEVWLPADVSVRARLLAPNLTPVDFLPEQAHTRFSSQGGMYVDHQTVLRSNAQRFHAQLYASAANVPVAPGAWQVVLERRDGGSPAHVHAWLHGTGPLEGARWNGGSAAYGINNAAHDGIVVGAYQHRPTWCQVSQVCSSVDDRGGGAASFSSRGPARDGRILPHLMAPGQLIVAPHPGGTYAAVQGTSYAAAVVSGAIALLFEAHPALTGTHVRTLLMQSAHAPPGHPALPNTEHGAGYLNIEAALHAADTLPTPTSVHACGFGQTANPLSLTPSHTLRMSLPASRNALVRHGTLGLHGTVSRRVRLRLVQEPYPVQEREIDLPETISGNVAFSVSPSFFVREGDGAELQLQPIEGPMQVLHTSELGSTTCNLAGSGTHSPIDVALSIWLEDAPAHLPVRWVSFEGWADGPHVHLAWETAEEVNAADFRVEHRREGGSWTEIGALPARGHAHSYTFQSAPLAWGTHDFRLRQTDVDGQVTLSHTISLPLFPNARLAVGTPYPNPAQTVVHLPVYNPSGQNVQVEVWDVQSRLLFSRTLSVTSPVDHIPIDLSAMPPGVFVYAVSTLEKRVVGTLVRAP